MAFNFSEENINEMYAMYRSALESIHQQAQSVVQGITEKARELKYELFIQLSKEAIEYYNVELKNAAKKTLEDWQQSDASFSKIMEKMRAGEDAIARSKELETQITDEIESWKSIDSTDLDSINTVNWNGKLSDFEEVIDKITSFIDSLEDEKNASASKIDNKKEENTIYIAIEPVILQTYSIVSEGFQSGISESYIQLSQEFERREQEAKSNGANASESIQTNSHNFINSSKSVLKAKVKTILE